MSIANLASNHGRRVAIVTGAGGGIGSAIAERLLQGGFAVAAIDLDGDRLARLEDRLREAGPLRPFAFDILNAADEAVAAVTASLGAPYALVNNAALIHSGNALTTSDADWARIIDNDLTAPFRMCRAVLPHMLARGAGVIVNVGTIGTGIGFRDRVAYCAAKSGLVGLTRAMAVDHSAAGIRINAVNPGTTETPLLQGIFAAADDPAATRRQSEAHQPAGRIGQPHEIAAAVAFLVSDEASYMFGSTITVDGGRSIW
jgi:NAD(P)-dependent dehydrogenase (short-subunit alcohol dehydrogenase family)